jgi:Mg2+ and Co2+ transporter CorA
MIQMGLDEFIYSLFGAVTKPVMAKLDQIDSRLKHIESGMHRLLGMSLGESKRDEKMAKSLDRLMQEVQENRDAVGSVETLVAGLAQQIRDAGGDEDALNKLADELDQNSNRLGRVVADNTPFQPSQQP